MIQNCDFTEKQMPGHGYTSCIKIAGIPILPPLITQERRQELQEDKNKAIELESRLKCERDLKTYIEQYYSPVSKSENSILRNNLASVSRTLENLICFDSDDSQDDALSMPDTSKRSVPVPSQTSVPSTKQNRQATSKLTCNIFDVTQYSDKGVVLFNEVKSGDAPKDVCNNSRTSVPSHVKGCLKSDQSPTTRAKPRLLRSNSYTLDAPSPELIEHFKRQAQLEPKACDKYLGQKRRSLDMGSSSCAAVLNDSGYKTDASKDTENQMICSTTFTNLDSFSMPCISQDEHIDNGARGCDIKVESVSHLVEDLAHLHFGTNRSESKPPRDIQKKGEDIHSRVAEAEAALHEVLNDMPENYAQDIMELLERHRLEQEVKLESYAKFKQKLLSESNLNNLTLPKPSGEEPQTLDISKETISTCDDDSRSCTLPCSTGSPTSTSNALYRSNSLLIELESDAEATVHFDCKPSGASNSDHPDVPPRGPSKSPLTNKSMSCSRELFVERPNRAQRRLREHWAGTVLTAAAKGYLVRRLKRTERVKNLIQTIRDALLCAVGLHTESTDSIQPSDVELHRRLIQQVAAACSEFYDVFFALTTKDKMAIIALDRQRLQEKLKRPPSSSSLKIESSRSTPRVQRQPFGPRQRKTLTPSFAA